MNTTETLIGKNILITGSARRIGRAIALGLARVGANILIHHHASPVDAEQVRAEIESMGVKAYNLEGDLSYPENAVELFKQVNKIGALYGLINSASIFKNIKFIDTTLADWQEHLNINMTAPFLLSQAFARSLQRGSHGRIINILDWRALRPGPDHFPYTVTKSALAAMTRSMAAALAPDITVNGLALGAILPSGESSISNTKILETIPAGRWGSLDEVTQTILFLLTCPDYITGEIIQLDGGRHLI